MLIKSCLNSFINIEPSSLDDDSILDNHNTTDDKPSSTKFLYDNSILNFTKLLKNVTLGVSEDQDVSIIDTGKTGKEK